MFQTLSESMKSYAQFYDKKFNVEQKIRSITFFRAWSDNPSFEMKKLVQIYCAWVDGTLCVCVRGRLIQKP